MIRNADAPATTAVHRLDTPAGGPEHARRDPPRGPVERQRSAETTCVSRQESTFELAFAEQTRRTSVTRRHWIRAFRPHSLRAEPTTVTVVSTHTLHPSLSDSLRRWIDWHHRQPPYNRSAHTIDPPIQSIRPNNRYPQPIRTSDNHRPAFHRARLESVADGKQRGEC